MAPVWNTYFHKKKNDPSVKSMSPALMLHVRFPINFAHKLCIRALLNV